MSNAVRSEEKSTPIVLEKIFSNTFQKEGTLTAQIRQTITTDSFYPSKKVASDMSGNIFSATDFGFSEQKFTSVEERVAWILVPVGTTEDVVKQKLEAANKVGACIYKVLSNQPILDDNQKYAIAQGLKTLDDFADAQAVRYPENTETIANGTANTLLRDKAGNVQYRRTFFWNEKMDDVDVRDAAKVYQSAKIKAELAGASVLQGQTI